ncbi:MAG: ATP-binding protein [Desulfobacteraceae bacterium]|nr:ATP-binding protein [Desulfobacteraceae bacterium]
MSEKLQFKISSALKNVIGRDLITDDFVAIFELVKNSFDAFANNITIQLNLEEGSNSRFYIIDDGKGMSRDDLINKWLFVAYSAKREKTEDKIEKVYAGNKGVGRFSCDRLGSFLKIQSKTKSDKIVHCLDIDWSRFEQDSKEEFVEIDVDYSTKKEFLLPQGICLDESGVVLEITNLNNLENWTRKKLIRLKRSLEKLVDPIGDVENDAKLRIICPRENDEDILEAINAQKKGEDPVTVNGYIKNTIFQVIRGKTTQLKVAVTSQKQLLVELIDRGVFIYKTVENIEERFPQLIGSNFYSEILFLNRAAKQTFTMRMGIHSVQYGSIFLIRNGFRVFPIGEEANDYWGIDHRKQQKYASYLGSRDLLGFVKISGDEKKFKESSSRNQGLIQTQAAIELSNCVLACIRKLEAYVVGVTWQDKLDQYSSEFERMALDSNRNRIIQLVEKLSKAKDVSVIDYNHELISILNQKASEYEPALKNLKTIATSLNDKRLIKQVEIAEKALLRARRSEHKALITADEEKIARQKAEDKAYEATERSKKLEEKLESQIKETLFVRSIIGTETKEVLSLQHHITHNSNLISGLIDKAIAKINENAPKEDLLPILSRIDMKVKEIAKISQFVTKANFDTKTDRIKKDIIAFINEYIENVYKFQKNISDLEIFITDIPAYPFEKSFRPIDLIILIDNFINNSKKAKAKKIVFSWERVSIDEIKLHIIDDGEKGIDDEIVDKIFDFRFSTTDGAGLGLFYNKDIMKRNKGSIKVNNKLPQGVEFILTFMR